ncbi:hypothetical protein [Streptomyces sp. UG1]|uniref:hypothetical protein n=1 Tax=Streptomyces sp. UG1 TaxID=3417652 RepID=UPI003CF843BC
MADIGAGRVVAAFSSLGAAAIHFASATDHYAQWWPAGIFFYAVGALQTGWAVAVLRPSGRVVMVLGLVANAGVIATWVVSRTEGFPVGPGAGVPEDITRVGITATAFEAVVCLVALWHVRRRTARGFVSSLRAVLLVGAAGAAVMGVTMPAVQGAMAHSHGHAQESTPHGDDGHEDGDAHESDPHEESGAEPRETGSDGASQTPKASPAVSSGHDEPSDDGHDDGSHGH